MDPHEAPPAAPPRAPSAGSAAPRFTPVEPPAPPRSTPVPDQPAADAPRPSRRPSRPRAPSFQMETIQEPGSRRTWIGALVLVLLLAGGVATWYKGILEIPGVPEPALVMRKIRLLRERLRRPSVSNAKLVTADTTKSPADSAKAAAPAPATKPPVRQAPPRATKPAPAAAPVEPPLVRFDRIADTLALAVQHYSERAVLFDKQQIDCTGLERGVVQIENLWQPYLTLKNSLTQPLDPPRMTRDLTISSGVDSAESHFDRSKCPRP